MAWTYDETDLDKSTPSGRLNVVRLLIGDTETLDQLLQDEEINFALSESNNNTYFAGAWAANAIAASYARRVTTKLDGALSAEYSDLAKQYKALSNDLREQGQKYSLTGTSLSAGGISDAAIVAAQSLSDRPSSAFSKGQFDNGTAFQYIQDND